MQDLPDPLLCCQMQDVQDPQDPLLYCLMLELCPSYLDFRARAGDADERVLDRVGRAERRITQRASPLASCDGAAGEGAGMKGEG